MGQFALTRVSQPIHITDALEPLGRLPERMLEQANLAMRHYCDPGDLIPAHHIYGYFQSNANGSPAISE